MSLKRTFLPRWTAPGEAQRRPRARLLCAGVLILGLGGSAGCDKYSTFRDVPVECSVEDAYELQSVDSFETIKSPPADWWSSNDNLVLDGGTSSDVEAISGGARCGSTAALVLRSTGANDWGTIFGFNNFGPRDEHLFEGMAFWARAPGNTSKGFTILLDDPNTTVTTGGYCIGVDGGTQSQTSPTATPGPGAQATASVGGTSPLPFQCGNSYSAVVTVTSEWKLYPIPFTKFTQTATPNRVPNVYLTDAGAVTGTGLITSNLVNLVIRFPKESQVELWLDNLSFYNRKKSVVDAEAGADVAQK
jgi:hypothetical protein